MGLQDTSSNGPAGQLAYAPAPYAEACLSLLRLAHSGRENRARGANGALGSHLPYRAGNPLPGSYGDPLSARAVPCLQGPPVATGLPTWMGLPIQMGSPCSPIRSVGPYSPICPQMVPSPVASGHRTGCPNGGRTVHRHALAKHKETLRTRESPMEGMTRMWMKSHVSDSPR